MLLGEKSELDQELKLRYQMAGMVHILAISGLHISILGMGLFSLLKRIGLGNAGAGLVSLCVMLQYGMLTGGSVSAMRAVCMFVLNVGARVLGRTYDLMTALALSAIFLLLDSPAYLYSSSFLLSFGAVVGLGAVSPHLIRITGAKGKAGKALISSLSVQAATLPVMLVFFGEVSVIGILLNLFVLPTVGGVLISGLCCSVLGLFSVNAGRAAAVPGRILLWLYEKVGMFAGKLPFCTWIGGLPEIWQSISYYLLLASGIILAYVMASGIQKKEENQLAVGKKVSENSDKIRGVFRKTAKRAYPAGIFLLAAAAGIFVLSRKPGKELRITCLDIGQGDGIVLEIPDGGVFLMDCGSSNKKNTAQYQLLPYLKSRGISHINGIMISHTDKDHISGIMELLEFMEQGLTSVRSDALILPDWEEPPEVYNTLIHLAHSAGMKVLQVESGNSFRMGEAGFHILAPAKDALGEDVNEEGMVVELEYRDFRGLFTGDAGEPAEKAILNRLRDVDFLKVGHHGSRYSSCREFLDQVKAEVAVISCSDSNTYGHPSPETTLRLKKSGAKTEFTMKSGAVSVCTDGKRMWVQRFLEE
ncbi:DNA internalization-related competence protein ComEC/Rec2 [Blautia sp. CAG:257]|uniref:DNA internalization-related competence protein ComEC/Rec2 n=1 Tax=Blautia sp. CAG:257 TaxID=1262756 RepID=UPI000334E18F|nr:DNA internalization-related competence protein ComEC/Rec2 [Blautia sp. CAG:257]CDA04901.1 dNA internalization competence protein ComEC/Rec2-like protein [Blautia sp. CAG:257]